MNPLEEVEASITRAQVNLDKQAVRPPSFAMLEQALRDARRYLLACHAELNDRKPARK